MEEKREGLVLHKDEAIQKTELQNSLTDQKVSSLKKYQDIALGKDTIFSLVKYELLITFIGSVPGALGLLLRKVLFKSLFGSVGKNVVFGKSLTIRHPHKIHIGENVVIDDYAVLDAKGDSNQGIMIGDNVMIGRNTVISCKNGNINIDNNTNIAMNCFIQSAKEVKIGKNVLFGAYCYVIGGGEHEFSRIDIPIISQAQIVQGITIKDNCWIGSRVSVLDGVTIGSDVILGAGAVATKSLPKYSVAVGVPAKIIRMRDQDVT